MSRVKDRTNQKFNRWTILTFYGLDKKGEAIWNCRCDCGFEKPLVIGNVVSGLSRQCKNCSILHNYKANTIPTPVWKTIIRNAKIKNHKVLITKEFAEELFLKQDQKCALSGLSIQFAKNNKEYCKGLQTASLDRINSLKDYTKNNIQWVHKNINKMKNNFNEGYYITICKMVVDHHNSKTNIK